jgi:hypothetical protein
MFRQWRLYYQTSELLAEWKEAFDSAMAEEIDSIVLLSDTLKRGEEFLRSHNEWAQETPPESRYTLKDIDISKQPEYLRPLLGLKAAPKQYHVYPLLQVELRHRISWFCRVMLIQAILHTRFYLDVLEPEKFLTPTWILERQEFEQLLAQISDELLASSTTCLMKTENVEGDAGGMEGIEGLKSGRAFLMMWPCAALTLCLHQAPLQTTDFGDRLEYGNAIMLFLQEHLGFEKAGAYINFQAPPDPRPQLWMVNPK